MTESSVITKQNSFDIISEKGKQLLEKNEFFKDLSEIMENDIFAEFFNKYFVNATELKVTVIYMKLYQEFKSKWKELTDEELDKRINTFLIWRLMTNQKTNKFTIQTVLNNLDNPKNNNIFDELKGFIDITDQNLKLKE